MFVSGNAREEKPVLRQHNRRHGSYIKGPSNSAQGTTREKDVNSKGSPQTISESIHALPTIGSSLAYQTSFQKLQHVSTSSRPRSEPGLSLRRTRISLRPGGIRHTDTVILSGVVRKNERTLFEWSEAIHLIDPGEESRVFLIPRLHRVSSAEG